MTFKHPSPPTIALPLHSGGEAVVISGHAAGAEIEVYRYRSLGSPSPYQKIGRIEKAPYADIFNMEVYPSLSFGNRVFAVQVLDGVESIIVPKYDAWDVQMPPYPLPRPQVITPLYSCARGVVVDNIVNGAMVEVWVRRPVTGKDRDAEYTDWKSKFKGPIGYGVARIMIPPLATDDEVKAIQSFPDMDPAESATETVVGYPNQRLPTPQIRTPLIECAPSFQVSGLVTGATLHVYRAGHYGPIIQMVAVGPTANVEVDGGLQIDWQLSVTQELCGEMDRSPRSDVVIVESIAALSSYPPEILRPVDEHAHAIAVKGLHESSIRILLDDQNEIGGGTNFGRTSFRLDNIAGEVVVTQVVKVLQSLECHGQLFEVASNFVPVGSTQVSSPLTEAEKEELLEAHNRWRATKGVPALTWSETLAQEAQQWADHLASLGLKYPTPDDVPHSDSLAGENIYWIMGSTGSTPDEVVDWWGSEEQWYNYNTNSCAPDHVCGHYTQVMWRDTKELGGGRAIDEKNTVEYWVCNYSPAGNWVGQKPY